MEEILSLQEAWNKAVQKKKIDMAMKISRKAYDLLKSIQFEKTFLVEKIYVTESGGEHHISNYGVELFIEGKKHSLFWVHNQWLFNVKFSRTMSKASGKTFAEMFGLTNDDQTYIDDFLNEIKFYLFVVNDYSENKERRINEQMSWYNKFILNTKYVKNFFKGYFATVQTILTLLYLPIVILLFVTDGKIFENKVSGFIFRALFILAFPFIKYFERACFMLERLDR